MKEKVIKKRKAQIKSIMINEIIMKNKNDNNDNKGDTNSDNKNNMK